MLLILFNAVYLTAQTWMPPSYNEGDLPAIAYQLYENKGQLINNNGQMQPDLKYYTIHGMPNHRILSKL